MLEGHARGGDDAARGGKRTTIRLVEAHHVVVEAELGEAR